MGKSSSEYVLGGTGNAALRLNLQHHCIKELFDGYLIDPSIKLERPSLHVADICTGTGIWLTQCSDKLPSDSVLEGFDINLTTQPAQGWLPSNISFKKFDIFAETPSDLIGRFDLINVQLTIVFVADKDVPALLQRFSRMLKPGGWLQWTEMDHISHLTGVSADPNYKVSEYAIVKATKLTWGLAGKSFPNWPANMKSLFEDCNFQNVKYMHPKMKGSVIQPLAECMLIGFEEARQTVLAKDPSVKEAADRLREAIEAAQVEFDEKGVGMDPGIVRCVGMKPLS